MVLPAVVARKAGEKAAARVAQHAGRKVSLPAVVGATAAGAVSFLLVVLMAFGVGSLPASAPNGTCPAGTPVPSSTDLSQATIDGVNALKPDYEAAGAAAGVPWTLLAAVDYRESGNDPNRSALSGEPIGSANPDNGAVTTSKRDSIDRAAEHLKAMASSVYGVALTASSGGDDVKKAALAYNRGYIYQRANASPDLSPYVLNQYDDAHRDMTWPSVDGEPLAGQVEYGRYGAFTVFTRLGGSAAGGCGGLSDDEIVRIAQQQLGLVEDPDGCNCGPEIQKFLGSSSGEFWCADFTSWVYDAAHRSFTGGVDGGWRLPAVSQIEDWVKANGEWHDRGDGDGPRPADVIVFRDQEHVGIVERVDDAGNGRVSVHTIEGNSSNAVSRRVYDSEGPGVMNLEIDGWGRQKAAA